ncbi:MAG: nucleoside monophosphate kinase [Planctomycetota bacterium]|nr:nucleoside monophosphate kinase [Planctomycetota bacterium]
MARFQSILLFGAPGAGKGTQGKILGQIPGFYHLSCGEVFRTLDINSDLGRTFVQHSSKGLLVPDDVTVKMWHQNMHARTVLSDYKPNVDLLVLDGIPRNVNQARLLEKHINVLQVIHLVCPNKEEMVQRLHRRALKENRFDDAKEDVIRKRWQIYEKETFPVLEYYRADLVREVDATGSPARVLEHILEWVVPIQEAHFNNPITGEKIADPAPPNGVHPAPPSTVRVEGPPPARTRAPSTGTRRGARAAARGRT